ncbi:hypothetical protein [Sneathiella glossodoripedis]|uniref:hypothetical protein n=1 Tax=Sneathiella glossodoripedis TaxID=418853 RepID=UPI000470F57E|nr:hypothetical protein [Sneathiella glossodoripedis]
MRRLGGIYCNLILIALSLIACSTPSRNFQPPVRFNSPVISDEALVWQGGRIAVPVRGSAGSLITTNPSGPDLHELAGAKPNTRWPVILILEACSEDSPPRLLHALAEQGFVAISLSSHQRRHVLSPCQRGTQTDEADAEFQRLKQAELVYAMRLLKTASWVDENNIFLLGQKESANLVARINDSSLRGRILVNWPCIEDNTGASIVSGDSPVFTVFTAAKPEQTGAIKHCEGLLSVNTNNQSVTLHQSYALNVLLEPIAFTQLLQFMDRQLFR